MHSTHFHYISEAMLEGGHIRNIYCINNRSDAWCRMCLKSLLLNYPSNDAWCWTNYNRIILINMRSDALLLYLLYQHLWRMEFSLICSPFFYFLLCFQSLEVRGFSFCFFCLKCWPSLFKLPEMWKKVNVWGPVDAVNLSVPGPNVVSGSLTIFWCSFVHVNSWPK